MVESFSFMAREAKKAKLRFCVEPRVGELLSNTDAILRMMDAVENDNFGAVLDTAHLNAQNEILALSVEKLGRRIFYVHAADNDGRTNDHLAIGRGTVDDRKSTRLNSSHGYISYAVFCLKKKKAQHQHLPEAHDVARA